jgi:hypothetical protein
MPKKLFTYLKEDAEKKWGLYNNADDKVLFEFTSADEAINFVNKYNDLFIVEEDSMLTANRATHVHFDREMLLSPSAYESGDVGEKGFILYRSMVAEAKRKENIEIQESKRLAPDNKTKQHDLWMHE